MTATGTTAAQTDDPTVRLVGGDVTASETATFDVVLTSAPDGLSGYYLRLSLDGTDVARIDGAAYPDAFSMTNEPTTEGDGGTLLLEAADLEDSVQAGAADVPLATVELTGVAPGEARVSVEPVQFDTDSGDRFQPATQSDVVTVAAEDSEDGAAGATEDASDGSDSLGDGATGAAGSVGGVPTVVLVGAAAALLAGGVLLGRRL
ncbi:hypothetical protein [Halogranum gelatinilyticum]|uniref:hypothetical protein n=1 Tax=Halogranum gelatinilyticum TaxID=660521 RepID=UPI000B7FB117|nr:hypothetical protein [Halogranum gelatinilyticum]